MHALQHAICMRVAKLSPDSGVNQWSRYATRFIASSRPCTFALGVHHTWPTHKTQHPHPPIPTTFVDAALHAQSYVIGLVDGDACYKLQQAPRYIKNHQPADHYGNSMH